MNPSNMSKEVESRLNGPGHSIQHAVETAAERLEKFSHDAGKKVGSLASAVSEETSEYVEASRGYIRKNPLRATAIATATGLAAGFLLTILARRK